MNDIVFTLGIVILNMLVIGAVYAKTELTIPEYKFLSPNNFMFFYPSFFYQVWWWSCYLNLIEG